jgi:uncharacterized protein HemX
MTEQFSPEINQLQQQQALFTQALRAMLEGKWDGGADTVEAFLYALDPNMQGQVALDVPVTTSELAENPK